MLVISSREFRANQKNYFDRIDNGEEIIIQKKGNKSYKISPITEDDTLMSKSEFLEKINISLEQIREGRSTKLQGEKELSSFLELL